MFDSDATSRRAGRKGRRCGEGDSFGYRWRSGAGRGRGRGEARRGAAEPGASASGAAPPPVARARDAADARGASFTPVGAGLSVLAAVARGFAQGRVSGHPLLGPERSRPPLRRRRRGDRAGPRSPGAGRPLRQGRQSSRPPAGQRVGQPLSRARAPHSDGGEARARLRPPQLPQAPPRTPRDRSPQLGTLVRRVAPARYPRRRQKPRTPRPRPTRPEPRRRSENLASRRRLAPRRRPPRARRTPRGVASGARPSRSTAIRARLSAADRGAAIPNANRPRTPRG